MTLNYKNAIIGVLFIIGVTIGGFLISEILPSNRDIFPENGNISRKELRTIISETTQIPSLTSAIPLLEMPKKMMVYKIDRTISEKDFKNIADNLGIKGEIQKVDRFLFVRNKSYQLDVEPSLGILNYKNYTPQQGYDDSYIETFLPSDQAAKKIADEFLDSAKFKSDDARFFKITHNKGYMATTPPTRFSETINVDYLHVIDSYPVSTDQLMVKIGVNGDILNVFKKWINHEAYREYSIITPDEAFRNLQDVGVVTPLVMIDKPEKAEVNTIYLAYIGETQAGNLDYLIPVYVFEGTVFGDNKTTEFYQWIPAVPNFTA